MCHALCLSIHSAFLLPVRRLREACAGLVLGHTGEHVPPGRRPPSPGLTSIVSKCVYNIRAGMTSRRKVGVNAGDRTKKSRECQGAEGRSWQAALLFLAALS